MCVTKFVFKLLSYKSMDPFLGYRRNSRGFLRDRVARLHPKVMFGPGVLLTPDFVQKNKITHIVNCAGPGDTPGWVPENFGTRYTCLSAIDSYNVDITEWYPQFESAMDKYLRSDNSQVVYVHCQAGMNRSGFLTVLYCCLKFQYKYDQACRATLIQRPCALANHVFHKQVNEYIKKHA